METNNKKFYWIAIIVVLVIVIVGGFSFWYYQAQQVNHLIPGVPYYGVYNLYPDFTSASISVATILRYYNDERVSFGELKNEFLDSRHDNDDLSHFQKSLEFFEVQGYETFSINLRAQNYKGNEVNEIKKFIKKDIPVIVIQQKRFDAENDDIERFGWRVVIGVFDDKKEIIVHDASLGNNYVFSYADFEKLFIPGASRMLVAWPKDNLVQSLPKPGNGLPYPARSILMENAYDLIGAAGRARAAVAAADALCFAPGDPTPEQINEFIRLNKESIRYRDEAINNPAFEMMPPIFQFRNKLWRTRSLMRIGEVSKAREILINELIPANKNLDKPVEGFEFADGLSSAAVESRVIDGQMPYVYKLLMISYWYEDKYQEATDAFMPYFKLDPNDESALKLLAELRDPALPKRVLKGVECMGGKSVIK